MKYYKLMYDFQNDSDVINCTVENLDSVNRYDVEKGLNISDWDIGIKMSFEAEEGQRFSDYVANNMGWFVVTRKFKEILDKVQNFKLQFIPIEAINKATSNSYTTFYLVNICSLLDGLDLEHSKYSVFTVGEEKVLSVKVYSMKKSVVEGHQIFRLKSSSVAIFVSEELKKEIEKNRITGCDFLEVKTF